MPATSSPLKGCSLTDGPSAVVRFLNYAEQDSVKHAQADAWPIVDVVAPAIEHPVVAGAQVLALCACR
jgi:hypothetical protein